MKNGEKPIANPFVMLREEFDDWAVLFNPDTGHGFGLNPTGVYLWKLLDGEHSIDDMLEALRRDADGVPLEAGEHLIAFVEELTEQALAGWEGERVQDYRRRISSCPTCAGTTKFNYEPPKLVNLSGERAARGLTAAMGLKTPVVAPLEMELPRIVAQGTLCLTWRRHARSGISPATHCCGGSTLVDSLYYGGSQRSTCSLPPGSTVRSSPPSLRLHRRNRRRLTPYGQQMSPVQR